MQEDGICFAGLLIPWNEIEEARNKLNQEKE